MIVLGKYQGRITCYGIIPAESVDKYDKVFVEFELVGRYDPATGHLESCPAIRQTYYKSTHPNSLDWLISDMKSLGYDKPSFRFLDPEVEGAVNWFGRLIDVVCEHGTGMNGQPREQWSLNRERTRKKATAETVARLDARCAAALEKAFGGATAAAPALVEINTSDETF
jgi:hypothetical protein